MIVTKHAKYRMKQRCGIGKNSINKMAKKVYQLGVRHAETSGNLQKWVDSLYFYNNLPIRSGYMEIWHTYFTTRS